MSLTDAVTNELAWALETLQTPPHVSKGVERLVVEREYRRLYALLRNLDNELRGWEPAKV